MNKLHKRLSVAALTGSLFACGGGGGSGSVLENTTNPPAQAFGLLKPAESAAEVTVNLKQGLTVSSGQLSVGGPPLAVEDFGDNEGGGEAGFEPDFSTTNVQVDGVDEADLTKYDGQVLYVLGYAQGNGNIGVPATAGISEEFGTASIRLFETDPDAATAEQVSQIDFDTSELSVSGLYLAQPGDQKLLLSIGQTVEQVPWELFALDYYWREGSTRVTAWDVTSPASPTTAWTLEFDGSLLTSRRIDDILYVVTRYTPSINGVVPYTDDPSQLETNRALIDAASIDDLLPQVQVDAQPAQTLVDATDCYLPNEEYEGLTIPPAGGSIITITAIDLGAPGNQQSICLNTFASGFYSSRSSIYITANGADDSTLIHKISLGNGNPAYRGSGSVRGYIGTTNPSYLMSESGDDLRVISSSWAGRGFPLPVMDVEMENPVAPEESDDFGVHRLTVLRESDSEMALETVVSLPNASRPQHIGKPGEDIYAARFLGDRAYAVTFQIIDPLYVFDLSDPDDPRIAGELEIPGFSSVLQPLGESLLLGVGSHVPDDGLGVVQGVKVGLFDVGNLASPVELGSVIIGKRGSSSPAQYNYHSLTILERDGVYRAALPVDRHATIPEGEDPGGNPSYWYRWTDSGLYKFEIDPGTGSLTMLDPLVTETGDGQQPWPIYNSYNSRSVIHGDTVFLTQESRVLAQEWDM